MFRNRRKQSDSLPTSMNTPASVFHYGSNTGNGSNSYGDGSGKAIRMEAPVSRAWKKATMYTKGTYYSMAACVFFMFFGYRWLRWSHASVHLICHTEECTFSITPRGRLGSHKVQFPRRQLIAAEAMKVTKDGTFVESSPKMDNFDDEKKKNGKKGKTTSYKGPDRNGHYPSYRIILGEPSQFNDNNEQTGDSVDGSTVENEVTAASLEAVKPFMDADEEGYLTVTMRKFNINQSRRRVKTTVQKIDSFIKKRRHKLTVKENTPPAWQGIVLLVLGIFGMLLTLLAGQFWDPTPTKNRRHSGPGTRPKTTSQEHFKGKRFVPPGAPAGIVNRRKT